MALLAALLVIAKMGLIYAEITCEAPAVRTGDPAYIICLFDVDVSVAKKNIKVQRRSLTSSRFDPDKTDTVLDCYWQNAADFSCQFGNGFKLVGEAGRIAVVGIGKASKIDEQVYMCEVVPSDPSNIKTCTLTVRDSPASDGNCSHRNVVSERLEGDTVAVKSIVTAIIIVLCVFITTVILVVVLFIFRKRLNKIPLPCCLLRSTSVKSPDIEDATEPMIPTESLDQKDSQGGSGNVSRDKEEIERWVRHLLSLKESGKLCKLHVESMSKGISSTSTSTDISMPTSHQTVENLDAKTTETKTLSTDYHVGDIRRLQLTVAQWYDREIAELNRIREEMQAEENLKAMKIEHEQQRVWRKQRDIKKKKPESKLSSKQKAKRQNEVLERLQKEDEAVKNLSELRKRHESERKTTHDGDLIRLQMIEQGPQNVDMRQTMEEKSPYEQPGRLKKDTLPVSSKESSGTIE